MIYREEQNFDWRVYVLVALAGFAAGLTLLWLAHKGANPIARGGLAGLGLSLGAFGGISQASRLNPCVVGAESTFSPYWARKTPIIWARSIPCAISLSIRSRAGTEKLQFG